MKEARGSGKCYQRKIKLYSKINGAQANSFFALKAYLTLKPYVILTVGLVVSTFVLGFALRTFEIGL